MPNTPQTRSAMDYLTDLMHGYWKSAILFAAVDAGLFEALAEGPQTAGEVAERAGTDPRATAMVLDALAVLKLVEKSDDVYSNAPTAERYLVSDSPTFQGNIIRHNMHMWLSWGDLPYVLRTGSPRRDGPRVEIPPDEKRIETFICGMYDTGSPLAEVLMSQVDLSGVRRMLDVGGGPGHYSFAAARRSPELKATVFDLPATLKITRRFITDKGMEDQVDTVAGDFTKDDLPVGYDLVLLSQVLHSYPPSQCKALMAKASRSLNPGGLLIVNEFALDETRTQPPSAVLFSVNMLVNTDGGSAYTRSEIIRWMQDAGVANIEEMDLAGRSTAFIGRKP